MQIEIQPVTFFRKSATVLKIMGVNVRQLGPGGSVLVLCILQSASGEHLHNEAFTLAGSDYDQWGSDDSYLLTKALEALGLTAA